MLEAAAGMAPSLSQLNYYSMIPASSPDTFGSCPISHQHDTAIVGPAYMHRFPFSLNVHHHGENVNANDESYILEFPSASRSLNHIMAMNNTATTTSTTCLGSAMDHSNNSSMNTKKSRNGKRKRTTSAKTSEEAENRRMTHIAVERNRRKQMNEHLCVLRSLMPVSYVQRGDQASIVGGAIEFVRELEQLLQSFESQICQRLNGPLSNSQNSDPKTDQISVNLDSLMMNREPNNGPVELHEETRNKSAIADVEVKLVGSYALIKILTNRRHGLLIKAISGLQDLEFTILHTNVTTIEQTALYLFNVKIGRELRLKAEDIANAVQQIISSIHANLSI